MKVVAIGGGTGLSTVLRGLKLHVADPARADRPEPCITRLTAVVTVTDEGGSSGRLRREFRVLPPGDIRNCLVAWPRTKPFLLSSLTTGLPTAAASEGTASATCSWPPSPTSPTTSPRPCGSRA